MKRKLLLLNLFLLCLILCACTTKSLKNIESSISQVAKVTQVQITADKANITKDTSKDSPIIKETSKNKIYSVINKKNNCYIIKFDSNKQGCIPTNVCKPIINNQITTPPTTTSNPNNTSKNPTTEQNKNNNNKPTDNSDSNKNNKSLTKNEQEMVNLVNSSRKQNGLNELKIDLELTKLARLKSQDLINNNYFDHNSPTYGSPFKMMKTYNISYISAGENIAGNQTVEKAHNALMNSQGHRENILNKNYTHIGIGIIDGGPYGKMFTQMFIQK